MDLKPFKSTKGGTLVILNPATNLPTDISIELVGTDSDVYQGAKFKAANKRMETARKLGIRYKPTAEEMDGESLEMLATCTLGWKNVTVDGLELPFTHENAVKLYRDYRFVRDQVDAFVGDRGNFFGS